MNNYALLAMISKCGKVLLVLFAISRSACQTSEYNSATADSIFRPKTESDFLHFKIQNKFVVALIINQQSFAPDLYQKIFRQIATVSRYNFSLPKPILAMVGDSSIIPSLQSLYKVDEVINAKIILFVHNQVVDFPGIIEKLILYHRVADKNRILT